jgi:YVTN family beta-propeller protein
MNMKRLLPVLVPVLVALQLAGLAGAAVAAPSLKEVARIRIGGEARWDYLAVDGVRHRLYVSHGTRTEVVDTETNRLVGTIADTPGVHGIAIAQDLGLGFISDGRADAVTVFELASLKTLSTIKVGANPDAIVYDPASRRVLTFNGKSNDVTFIDAAHGVVIATLRVGGKPEFAQLGEDGNVWFNLEDTGEMAVLDPRAGKLLRRQSLAPCDSPSGLAVDERHRLYAVCENRQMVAVEAGGQVIGRATIGAGSDGVAWLDGAAYSANGADGTISVVRETSPGHVETVETVATAAGARTIAADPATHRLYLPTADMQPAKPGERRAGVPDTFYVLVLEQQR